MRRLYALNDLRVEILTNEIQLLSFKLFKMVMCHCFRCGLFLCIYLSSVTFCLLERAPFCDIVLTVNKDILLCISVYLVLVSPVYKVMLLLLLLLH